MADGHTLNQLKGRISYFSWPEVNHPELPVQAAVVASNSVIPEDLLWEKPFVDTGRGGLPFLTIAENPQYVPPAESWEHFVRHRLRYLVAGGVAGGLTRILTHPFDRARTSMQLNSHEPQFKSMSSTFLFFWKEQGKLFLWRGLDISLARIVPEISLKFAVYEDIKRRFRDRHHLAADGRRHASFRDRFIAGGVAGLVSHTFSFPLSVVAARMSAQRPWKSEFSGISDAFQKLYALHGIPGFYRGFFISLCSIVPSMGLDFAIYGQLKKVYKNHFHTQGTHPPAWVLLLCGATSSTLTHLCVYPLLLPRIRMQAADPQALRIQTTDENVLGYLNKLRKAEGMRGLYRGLTPSLAKAVPAVSLSYFFYERLNQRLAAIFDTQNIVTGL